MNDKTVTSAPIVREKDPYRGILLASIGFLGFVVVVALGMALYRAIQISRAETAPALITPIFATEATTISLKCEELIEQAMLLTGTHCDKLGPNQVCYGNTTVNADLLPQALTEFNSAGDVVSIDFLQKLTTAPLDLNKQEWGIAVMNITANLPRSLPGESVKMMVLGNTTLGNSGGDVQSFYFFSDLGRIVCDEVPFDGLMITMPDGTGINLVINGSEVTLEGNASLTAVRGGNMEVNLYSGTASVTADGQTQMLTAGQSLQVPLGGETGTESIGAPSEPTIITTTDFNLTCLLAGLNCTNLTAVPTLPIGQTPLATGTLLSNPTVAAPTSVQPPPTQPAQNTPVPESTQKIPPGQLKKTPSPEPIQPPEPTQPPEPNNPGENNGGGGGGGTGKPKP